MKGIFQRLWRSFKFVGGAIATVLVMMLMIPGIVIWPLEWILTGKERVWLGLMWLYNETFDMTVDS